MRRRVAIFGFLAVLLVVGTVAYQLLEDWSWIQSFYFTVATLSTVGYGELHPTSDASRLFTSIYIIVGVAVAVSAVGIIAGTYLSRQQKRIDQDQSKH